MNTLLITIAFVLVGIGGYLQGRRIGARSMALTIARVGERKYKNFKETIAKGMLDDLNKHRKEVGKDPIELKIKSK